MNLERARARAEAYLVTPIAVTRAAGSTFTPGVGIANTTPTAIWSGFGTLVPPSGTGDTSQTGGDETAIDTRVVQVPRTTDGLLKVGDTLVATGFGTFVIERISSRSNEVLRRIRVVSVTDTERVPR